MKSSQLKNRRNLKSKVKKTKNNNFKSKKNVKLNFKSKKLSRLQKGGAGSITMCIASNSDFNKIQELLNSHNLSLTFNKIFAKKDETYFTYRLKLDGTYFQETSPRFYVPKNKKAFISLEIEKNESQPFLIYVDNNPEINNEKELINNEINYGNYKKDRENSSISFSSTNNTNNNTNFTNIKDLTQIKNLTQIDYIIINLKKNQGILTKKHMNFIRNFIRNVIKKEKKNRDILFVTEIDCILTKQNLNKDNNEANVFVSNTNPSVYLEEEEILPTNPSVYLEEEEILPTNSIVNSEKGEILPTNSIVNSEKGEYFINDNIIKFLKELKSGLSSNSINRLIKLSKNAQQKKQERIATFSRKNGDRQKCQIPNKYVNLDLNINVMGTSRPHYSEYNYRKCFKLLREENVIIYITFDGKHPDYPKILPTEIINWGKVCIEKNCKFYDLPVIDYKIPTREILLQFWEILYDFHNNKRNGCISQCNLLMHCSAGRGRTGFMIMSYIWLMMILKNPTKYIPLTSNVEKYLKENKDYKREHFNFLFEMPILNELKMELNKYDEQAVDEIYHYHGGFDNLNDPNYNNPNDIEVSRNKLFIDRLNIIIKTISELKMLSLIKKASESAFEIYSREYPYLSNIMIETFP